jgi:PqqD family protein of HPr-rel-A system
VPDRILRRAPGLLFERVGDDTAVLDPATGDYTRLNATGSALWELLATPATAADLADRLAREFGLDRATAREDADRFVGMLRERGLLASG